MNPTPIQTKSLKLVPQTRAEVRALVEQMPPHERAQVSPAWLALLDGSSPADPWIHGFVMVHRATESVIGQCAFTGPPGADSAVEIAYGVAPEHQGKGYATEAAAALVSYAFSDAQIRVVRAHTLPEANASTRVLTKCGFQRIGEVMDPEDGLVWRWEKAMGRLRAKEGWLPAVHEKAARSAQSSYGMMGASRMWSWTAGSHPSLIPGCSKTRPTAAGFPAGCV